MKALNTEYYKTLKKEIKENIDKWKNILCSQTEKLNIIKISILWGLSILNGTENI